MVGHEQDIPAKSKDDKTPEETQYISGFRLIILFASLCLIAVLATCYMTVISTAIPLITTYFGTIEDVDWYGTAYLLTICSLQPLTGHIFNLFRVKATFITFLGVFALGNLIGALAKSSATFIVGRAIAGIGGAGMFNGSMVIFSAAAAPNIRPQLMALSMSMVGFGAVIGPLVGGAVTEHLGWRWCLWIFLPPIGAISLLFFFLRIPEQTQKSKAFTTARQIHHKIDILGFILFVSACIMLLLALSWGGSRHAWKSATEICLICAAIIAIAFFGTWIRFRQDRALIPPSLLMKPAMLCGCCVAFLQGAAFLQVAYYLPLYFQSVKGANPQKGGLMMLPTCIAQVVAGVVSAALIKKVPYAPVWAIVGNIFTAVGSGLMTTFSASSPAREWIGYQVLSGAGRGISMQMPIIALQEVLSPTQIPIASANILFFQYFAGAAANCIAKAIFLNTLGPALTKYAPNVDAQAIIHKGATEVLKTVDVADRVGVIESYNKALTSTFWLPTVTAIIACFFSSGLGWHKVGIKKKEKAVASEQEDHAKSEEEAEALSIAVVTKA